MAPDALFAKIERDVPMKSRPLTLTALLALLTMTAHSASAGTGPPGNTSPDQATHCNYTTTPNDSATNIGQMIHSTDLDQQQIVHDQMVGGDQKAIRQGHPGRHEQINGALAPYASYYRATTATAGGRLIPGRFAHRYTAMRDGPPASSRPLVTAYIAGGDLTSAPLRL
jgi:hypothetical protein